MAYEDRIVKDNMHKRLVGREKGTMTEISEPLTFTQVDSDDLNAGHALIVRNLGDTIVESFSDLDVVNGELVLSDVPEYVRILNSGDNFLLFTVNSLPIPVPPGLGLETGVDSSNGSNVVTVTGSSNFAFQRLV